MAVDIVGFFGADAAVGAVLLKSGTGGSKAVGGGGGRFREADGLERAVSASLFVACVGIIN